MSVSSQLMIKKTSLRIALAVFSLTTVIFGIATISIYSPLSALPPSSIFISLIFLTIITLTLFGYQQYILPNPLNKEIKNAAIQARYLRSESDDSMQKTLVTHAAFAWQSRVIPWPPNPEDNYLSSEDSYFLKQVKLERNRIKSRITSSGQDVEEYRQIKKININQLNNLRYYNQQDADGMIPLMFLFMHASLLENLEMITSLISESDCNLQNIAGETALHLAIINAEQLGDQAPTIIQLLVNQTNCDLQNIDGENPIHLAIGEYASKLGTHANDIILALIRKTTQFNLQNFRGCTPLDVALRNASSLRGSQKTEIIQQLIKNSNCHVKNVNNHTPLHLAIYCAEHLGDDTEAIFQNILLKNDLNTIDLRPGFINFFKKDSCTERQQKMILTLAKRSRQFIPEGAFEQPLLINNPALKVLLDRIIIGKERKERMATLIAGQRRLRERGYPQLPPELFEVIRDQFLDSSDQDSDNNPPATPLGP